MAKKDTLKALTNRGISDETANLMLTRFSSLASISAAGGCGPLADLVDDHGGLLIGESELDQCLCTCSRDGCEG